MPTLENWESRLKPYFGSHLRIIGEIQLSETEVDELAEDVRHFLGGFEYFTRGTKSLTDHYPCAFLTLLAQFAMYNDQAGYWQALQKRVGADQDLHITDWHQRFVSLVSRYGLKTFTEKEAANFYVATIRFHGGIPSYSLPDLFERMVGPAVNLKELREIPLEDALAYLLDNVRFVDRPVLDFLENSGEMGLVWFEACCKLVRHAQENQREVLPSAEVPGLPYYIHAFFEQHIEEQEDHDFHWSRPYLEVTPLSEDSPILLQIPSQKVPLRVANQGLQWCISWPELETPIIIPCQLGHRREGEFTGEEFFSIPSPATQVTVSIYLGQQDTSESTELRRWTIPLLPPLDQAPLIAFRENRRQVPNSQTLPAQPLYFLTPKLSAMEVDPTTEILDSFPPFSGGWSGWKLELWDLSNALSLLLYQDGTELGNIIPVAREAAQPELTGGHLFDYQEKPDQPLYTSGIPAVRIPVAANITEYQALAGWKLTLASFGDATPTIDKQVTLLDYREQSTFEGDRATFPLQLLMGEKPAGIYDVKVSGPKGLICENRLRLWPKLLLQSYSKEFPKPEESRRAVKFGVYLQEDAWVENQPGAEPVEITSEYNGFWIEVKPGTRRVQLDLVASTAAGGQVRVPVSIPVVRLRWGLAEGKSPGKLNWSQEVLRISKERFAQYASSALHVEMHGLAGMMDHLSCQLVEADNEDNLLQQAKFSRTDITRDWLRVSMGQFIDTIPDNTQVQFQLVYQKDWQSPVIRYALLEVSPDLDITDVALQQVGECDWKLTWKEDFPLKHRRVLLKSAWQPWQPVIEQKIPDENRGEFTFTDLALPPSRYEIYFYIKHSWENSLTAPPQDGTCEKVDLSTPEERLRTLKNIQDGHDSAFRNCIEVACILDSIGQTEDRDNAVSKAATHLVHLQEVRTLVGSIKWMRTKDIESPIMSYFSKNMFHQNLVKAILSKYSAGDEKLAEYLQMIKPGINVNSARLLLEKVDDPQVISSCVKTLLDREDEELSGLIISMLKKGHLSAGDAADLLINDPEHRLWALETIGSLESSITTDSLLAAMLPGCLDENTQTYPAWMQDAILRAVRNEKSSERVQCYLEILIKAKRDDVWQVVTHLEKHEQIKSQDFYELLKLNPKKALQILIMDPDRERYADIIQRLEREFPLAADVLVPGMTLQTPFGQAQIVSIQLSGGATTQSVHLADGNFTLNMVGGTGRDLVRVALNFESLTFEFNNAVTIYQCTTCGGFSHPRQARVEYHHTQLHPNTNIGLKTITGAIPFKLDDIKYTN